MGVEVEDDDSFKKPGAVPFKWEIKPGLPIISTQQKLHQQHHQKVPEPPSPKLRPPPSAGSSYLLSPVEPRTRSFRSNSRARSDRWRFERPLLARPESVSSGCFFSPFLKRLRSRKTVAVPPKKRAVEPDCASEIETLGRWSLSSGKSLSSPFRASTMSSPRPVSDAEWAGFGLF